MTWCFPAISGSAYPIGVRKFWLAVRTVPSKRELDCSLWSD